MKLNQIAAILLLAASSAAIAPAQNYEPLSRKVVQSAQLEREYLTARSNLESNIFQLQNQYDLCMQRVQATANGNPHGCDNYKNAIASYQTMLRGLTPPPSMRSQAYQPYASPQPMTTNTTTLSNQYQQWQNSQQGYQNQTPSAQPQYPTPTQSYQPYAQPQPMTSRPSQLEGQYDQWRNRQQSNQSQGSYARTQPYYGPATQPYGPYATPQPVITNPTVLNSRYQQWQNLQPFNQAANRRR